MNRFHISTQHAVLLGAAYFIAPVLLILIGYTIYSNRPPPPVEHHVYQLKEFRASNGTGAADDGEKSVFELPPLMLSMSSGIGDNSGIMKINLDIEVSKEDLIRVPDYEPRIIERITLFLLKKTYQDMQDPRAMKTLMARLVDEINNGAIPLTITNVFVRQFVFE